jgi:urea transport system ATP-binding protein
VSTLLEVSGVSVSFDGFRAINNLSFNIGPAELRAIIGPNGAGKTTFMDIVTGKTRPDEGQVLWGETSTSLLRLSESQIARAGVGRKFQRPTVFEDQSVEDNLLLALKKNRSPFRCSPSSKAPRMPTPSPKLAAGDRPWRAACPQGRRTVPRAEAVARNRHAARPGPATAAGR